MRLASIGANAPRPGAPAADGRSALARIAREPLAAVLIVVVVVRLVALTWGLPASDGWDDDAIAPRDFLVGVVQTYSPGSFYTYPPLHALLLTVVTAPVWIAGLLHCRSLAPPDVVHELIRVPYMTALTAIARLVSVAMSAATVWALAGLARDVRGPRAAWLVACTCGFNAVLTYYGHTSNLDGPYLFWGALSFLQLARAMIRGEPRRLRWSLWLAAAAVATKDQASAMLVLALPAALVVWLSVDPWPRRRARAVVRELSIGVVSSVVALALVEGAVVNPHGFRARVAFLLGPASQDHAYYAPGWRNWPVIARDALRTFGDFYPPVYAVLIAFGAALALKRRGKSPGAFAAAWIPLLVTVSFSIAFTFAARRTEHRFLLPQMLFCGVYAGIGLDGLLPPAAIRPARLGDLLRVGLAALSIGWGLYLSASVDANLILDPRYDTERYLSSRVAPGDVVETYGSNVYLPRFPQQAHVVRVGPTPVDRRNPLPDVTEIEAAYAGAPARRPRWIVVPAAFSWMYLFDEAAAERRGRTLSPQQAGRQNDLQSRRYFEALYDGRLPYRRAHVSTWTSRFWRRADIHASTARDVVVFERVDSPSSPPLP